MAESIEKNDAQPNQEKQENKEKQENLKDNAPKLVIQVILTPGGMLEMKSTLQPPLLIFALEQLKYDVLKRMNETPENKIIKPQQGNIFNFVRGRNFKR